MQNLVTASHTVCAHVGGPKIMVRRGPAPLGWRVADPAYICPSFTRYHSEFGRSRSNRTGVGTEIHREYGSLVSRLLRLLKVVGSGTLKTREWKTEDHEKYGGGKRGTGKRGIKSHGWKRQDWNTRD